MFPFEKLHVYQNAKEFHLKILNIVDGRKINSSTKNQILRSSMSVPINIAEGSGRLTTKDRKNFIVISRGSVFETVALLQLLRHQGIINKEEYLSLNHQAEHLSKMLYALI